MSTKVLALELSNGYFNLAVALYKHSCSLSDGSLESSSARPNQREKILSGPTLQCALQCMHQRALVTSFELAILSDGQYTYSSVANAPVATEDKVRALKNWPIIACAHVKLQWASGQLQWLLCTSWLLIGLTLLCTL